MSAVGDIRAVAGGRPALDGATSAAQDASPRFQELLERLQRLAASQPRADEVDSPETLRQALQTADEGFVAAMDLRRQLEEAFRKQTP